MTDVREPMAGVDAAWLRMERDTNLMMIGGVLVLDRPLDMARFRQVIEERFLKFRRFRQRVVDESDKVWWEMDPAFNLDNHIHRVGLPSPADKAELQQLVSDLISTPLDFRRPLWQMHVVDQFDGGSALIVRIHHCIADGLALVQVLLSMTDETEEGKPADAPIARTASLTDRLLQPAQSLIREGLHLGHELIEEAWDLVEHPTHLIDLAKQGMDAGLELAHIGLLPPDPVTVLKGGLSGRKRVAWAEALDLGRVKATAHALSGTVNDVLMATVAGALRQYLMEKGNQLAADIHVAVPFNLRPRHQPIQSLGNQFGLVVVNLPVGKAAPRERYQAVKEAMETLKASAQPKVTFGLLTALGHGPAKLERTALDLLSKKASLIMTNVPGPSNLLYLAGAKVLQPMVWVPQSGEIGVGLSILSYAGTVQFGVVADQKMIEDAEKVAEYFRGHFDELEAAASNVAGSD
ncbi:WS/DGAT/MGAT family O-acyltransferase [Mangrovitalea sediminis]|uniref:WS/DGAT/MGAT family O-acyltransferase n=1 Tax=Mangrovitalea sediminis TaxID=1982043 RepID=UPI000BE622CC|nr:wax ester/triacylglycerol synthase family O-acyltransferase [Mangrovitalea sediminis]